MTKTYPFNMSKYGHDIFYRYNRAKNECYDQDPEMVSGADYDRSKHNYELMIALQELLGKGSGIVWLTGKEYGLARECVAWADSARSEARNEANRRKRLCVEGDPTAKKVNEWSCTTCYDYLDLYLKNEPETEESYTGSYREGQIVDHHGHECRVTKTWRADGKNGISIIPTGNYGFEIDIYEEQL